jgi:hypothetical protein
MTPLAQVRALLERLQEGGGLSEAEAERLGREALALRRRLERLRALAPEVDVELDPRLATYADRAARMVPA